MKYLDNREAKKRIYLKTKVSKAADHHHVTCVYHYTFMGAKNEIGTVVQQLADTYPGTIADPDPSPRPYPGRIAVRLSVQQPTDRHRPTKHERLEGLGR